MKPIFIGVGVAEGLLACDCYSLFCTQLCFRVKTGKKRVNEAAHASLYKLTSRFWIVAAHLLGWSLQNYY